MRSPTTKYLALAFALILAPVIVYFVVLRGAREARDGRASTPGLPATRNQDPFVKRELPTAKDDATRLQPSHGSLPLPSDSSTLSDTAGEGLLAEDEPEESMSDVMQAVLNEDPGLFAFWKHRSHVLMDQETRSQYHELLSDPEMFKKVKEDILAPKDVETRQSLKRNLKQLVEIDFLKAALVWEGNPRREDIILLIEELLLEDNFHSKLDSSMRYTLATGKLELYELLYDHAPDVAQGVNDKAKGTRLEELLAYVAEKVDLHRNMKLEGELQP